MQASLNQNIEAPEFLRKNMAQLAMVAPSSTNSQALLTDESMQLKNLNDSLAVQSGKNSKKNLHPNFKLDLSKCVNEEEYEEQPAAQSEQSETIDLGSIILLEKGGADAKENIGGDVSPVLEQSCIESLKIEIS